MKKLLLVFLFVCSTNLFAQHIDNIVLLNNSTPPSLQIYGSYGSTGVSFTSITHEISDTFKIKLFFKACAGLTVIVPFDTIIAFNNNWPAAPTHLEALSILDTTTTDLNCHPVTAGFEMRISPIMCIKLEPTSLDSKLFMRKKRLEIYLND